MDRIIAVLVVTTVIGSIVLGADYVDDREFFFVHPPRYELSVNVIHEWDGTNIVSKRADITINSSSADNDINLVKLKISKVLDGAEKDRHWFHKEIIYKRYNIINHRRLVLHRIEPVSELPAGTYRFKADIYTTNLDAPLRSVDALAEIDNMEASLSPLVFNQWAPGGPRLYGTVDDEDTYRFQVSMRCYRNLSRGSRLVDTGEATLENTRWLDIPVHGLTPGNYTAFLALTELDSGPYRTTDHLLHFTFEAEPPDEDVTEKDDPQESTFQKYPHNKLPGYGRGAAGYGGGGGCGGI